MFHVEIPVGIMSLQILFYNKTDPTKQQQGSTKQQQDYNTSHYDVFLKEDCSKFFEILISNQ